jgi:small-conductance mechanosensitive channel
MDRLIYGNTLVQWAIAAIVALLVGMGLKLVAAAAVQRLRKLADVTANDVDDLLAELLARTRTLFIVLISFWAGSRLLLLPPELERGARVVLVLGLLLQAGVWGTAVIHHALERYRRRQLEVDPSGATALGALSVLARLGLWVIIVLTALANLGLDITAFVASLGIAGIAVGLALQNVLGDLFASLSIVLDKPFVVGDFIVVGDFMGTVEHVGLKTTRLRSLSGEQLVFSNSDLLGSRIRNYKRMSERRALFTLGVTYDTPLEKLRAIPALIREVVEAQPNTRFDRSHFRSYGAFSLDVETVYFMLVPDYNAFMDTQQAINLALFERFADEGIEFAFPTQTLHVRGALEALEAEPATPGR